MDQYRSRDFHRPDDTFRFLLAERSEFRIFGKSPENNTSGKHHICRKHFPIPIQRQTTKQHHEKHNSLGITKDQTNDGPRQQGIEKDQEQRERREMIRLANKPAQKILLVNPIQETLPQTLSCLTNSRLRWS